METLLPLIPHNSGSGENNLNEFAKHAE